MIRNYLKTAFRSLKTNKFTSFSNLFGITLGLTCCMLILCYVLGELHYDRFKESDNIYRVTRSFNTSSGTVSLHLGAVAPAIGPLLENDFPDIREMTRMLVAGTVTLEYGDKTFNEDEAVFGDAHFFDFFTVPVLHGNPKSILSEPYSVALTPELAKRYFGDQDPLGKMVKVNNQFLFKVTGIFQDLPSQAHLHPQMLLSFSSLNDTALYGKEKLATNWDNNAFYTYLLFPPHYPVSQIEKQFPAFLNKHFYPEASKNTALYLQPLRDIHLHSHLDSEIEPNGNITTVYIFSAIALFILLIACINYMNLATARSMLRAREIGVRKVIGAGKRELIMQILGESVLLTLTALILALALTRLLLPWLEGLADRTLSMNVLFQGPMIAFMVLLPLVVGILSGIYPALFIAGFKPVAVLKGKAKMGSKTVSLRKSLVILQFTISIVLIIATAVVFRQLYYVQNTSLGFDKEHIVTLRYTNQLDHNYAAFRDALLKSPGVKEVALSSRIPSGRLLDEMGLKVFSGDSAALGDMSLKYVVVDDHFIPAYGIGMAAGRNFAPWEYPTDSSAFVINAVAANMMGWSNPEDAIGKNIEYGGQRGQVIGVTRPFHFESMRQQIIPLLLMMGQSPVKRTGNISIRLGVGDPKPTLAHIRKVWQDFAPETPFNYVFLDTRFARLYASEQHQESLFMIFSIIAIFIACLGLFGLSAFTISQRIKEIGIRKVLGASVSGIVGMLSLDFLKLVGLAAMIALPVGWLCMHRWLQGFAYHIPIPWWLMLCAALLALMVALLTIGIQAMGAARTNPVKTLRSE